MAAPFIWCKGCTARERIFHPAENISPDLLLFPIPEAWSEDGGWPLSILKFAGVTGTRLTCEVGTYNQPIGSTDHSKSEAKGLAVNSGVWKISIPGK